MSDMYKKALDTSLASTLAGAAIGGVTGFASAGLLWKKPKKKRILSTLAGLGIGAASGAGLHHALSDTQPKGMTGKLRSKLDSALQTLKHGANSALGGALPEQNQWLSMSPFQKALYGDTKDGTFGLGRLVKQTKDALGLNQGDEASTLGSAIVGGISLGALGPKVTGVVDSFSRRKNLIKALQDMAAKTGGQEANIILSQVGKLNGRKGFWNSLRHPLKSTRSKFVTAGEAGSLIQGINNQIKGLNVPVGNTQHTQGLVDQLANTYGSNYRSTGRRGKVTKGLGLTALFLLASRLTTGAQHLAGVSPGTQAETLKNLRQAVAKNKAKGL